MVPYLDWRTSLPFLIPLLSVPNHSISTNLLGTILITASTHGTTSLVNYLLNSTSIDPDYTYPHPPSSWSPHAEGLEEHEALCGSVTVTALKKWLGTWFDSEQRTALSFAAGGGHLDTVGVLVEKGAKAGKRDYFGRTALSWAAGEGRLDVVRYLAGAEGVEIDAMDNVGRRPLVWAVLRRREEGEWDGMSGGLGDGFAHSARKAEVCCDREAIVKLLVEKGADVDGREYGFGTPLMRACSKGMECVVDYLLSRGADAGARDGEDKTALTYAARFGRDGVVRMLLNDASVEPDARDFADRTPVSFAAQNGHDEIVNLLLEKRGVNPDSKDAWGRSPLSFAAEYRRDAVVELLLRRGVDPDSQDTEKQTPLLWAARGGGEGVVRMLLGVDGVQADQRDALGQTPLWWAARTGFEGIARMLVGQGKRIDINALPPTGHAPITVAAMNGFEAVVGVLLGREDIQAEHVNAALNLAIWSGKYVPKQSARGCNRFLAVKRLLEHPNVDLNARDAEGRTALIQAVKGWGERIDLVELLIEQGADIMAQDNKGRTALQLAEKKGRLSVLQLLRDKLDSRQSR